MIKIISLLLFPLLLAANGYPHFTTKDFINLEKKSGRIAKNRAMDYQQKVESLKPYDQTKQLNILNNYLNQLLPQYDAVMQKQEDYWASPKEFLQTGYGDCEDYVIIKYFSLLKLGFDKDRLYLTTVHELYTGGYHMVLSYFKKGVKSPLILDNLSFRILELSKRNDIKADTFINANGVFKIDKNFKLKKIARASKQYINLMKKVQKNR
ncbi:MAG: transglutaminase-like cysteine peptidase [Helicobacteraceae bacterium]|nr:transglutaminase-like cysteine peptidase [Candidatus Sulfurimonas ponti]MBL6973560.1 transglutaminase-like cysteine peptidase [Sulfurimonas sp.]